MGQPLIIVSKHADACFHSENGFALFWHDTPEEGQGLSVEYNRTNYPAVVVAIMANRRQEQDIAEYRSKSDEWKEERF